MKLIVTGFEPFDGREVNQSSLIGRELAEAVGAEFLELPVTFKDCFSSLENRLKIDEKSPEKTLVFSLGEAPVDDVRMEHVALNRVHAPGRGDNLGEMPVDQTLSEGRELALQSDYSPVRVLDFFQAKGLEFSVSYSAGQYVCNCLFWRLLESQQDLGVRAVFFHVPVKVDLNLKTSVLQRLKAFIEAAKKGEL